MTEHDQKFVAERLHRALVGRLTVEDQRESHLDKGKQVHIKPDLQFRYPASRLITYVGDIRYKLAADAVALSADYSQLLAYTTALDLPEGVLIYCHADGDKPASEITVRHAGKKLHVRALDLSGSPAEVGAEIERLAGWIAGRSDEVRPRGPLRVAHPAEPFARQLSPV